MDQQYSSAVPASGRPRKNLGIVIAIIVVVVVILAALGYWFYERRETSRDIGGGARLTAAPAGKVVSEFPKDLILDSEARVTESYRINYTDGDVSQPVVSYVSAKGVRDNILDFRLYLTGHGWELIEPGNSTDVPATFILAAKEKEQVNVTLQPLPDGKTQVVIAYTVNN